MWKFIELKDKCYFICKINRRIKLQTGLSAKLSELSSKSSNNDKIVDELDMGLSTVTVTTVMWLCQMTGALENDARSDQDIVIATLRLNYGRVRAIPNPCAICPIFTPNANVPVIWDPRTPLLPPPLPSPPLPSAMTEAFTFYASESKWILRSPGPKWMVNSPAPIWPTHIILPLKFYSSNLVTAKNKGWQIWW